MRICSTVSEFKLHSTKWLQKFLQRGYKHADINQIIDKTNNFNREDLLEDTDQKTKI